MSSAPHLPDDAELLERHALAHPGDAADPALERFRVEQHALVRVTDRVLAMLRTQLHGAPVDTERALAALKERLPRPSRTLQPSTGAGHLSTGTPLPFRRVWYTLGAVATGAALLVTGWAFGRTGRRPAPSGVTYTTYATTNGQQARITLPDGNTVSLGVASRLEVPTNYSAGNHTVRLPLGEAFFSVSHHAGVPFTVLTGTTAARVLGTAFTVRHYAADTSTIVAVRDGKVAVGHTVVTAQQLVAIGSNGTPRVRPADASWFSFASGVLMLDSTRLSSAIPELDRWYDADIRLGDPSLASQMVEGNFTTGSLADLAAVLEWTFQVRVVRDGRVVTLYPKQQ